MYHIDEIKYKLRNEMYYFTNHSLDEQVDDLITLEEIEEAFENVEIIESYHPKELKRHRVLLLGFTNASKPLHFVVGRLDQPDLHILTMYRPSPAKWVNFRKRKRI